MSSLCRSAVQRVGLQQDVRSCRVTLNWRLHYNICRMQPRFSKRVETFLRLPTSNLQPGLHSDNVHTRPVCPTATVWTLDGREHAVGCTTGFSTTGCAIGCIIWTVAQPDFTSRCTTTRSNVNVYRAGCTTGCITGCTSRLCNVDATWPFISQILYDSCRQFHKWAIAFACNVRCGFCGVEYSINVEIHVDDLVLEIGNQTCWTWDRWQQVYVFSRSRTCFRNVFQGF